MLEGNPIVFVGKIYILPTGKESLLIYSTSDIDKGGYTYDRIVNENLISALGNDSVIYVKANTWKGTGYYLVKHNKGEKVVAVKEIDSLNFSRNSERRHFKYSYQSKSN
jgi:hypothetical protein